MNPRLSETIDEYLLARAAMGVKPNTVRNDKRACLRTLTIIGNLYLANITPRHIDAVFVDAATTNSDASLNTMQASLGAFFTWCRSRGYMRRDHDPLAGRRLRPVKARDRRRVPLAKFPALLDAAPHPRDRMVVACGLYLFLRASEIESLKVGDVDLASGGVRVQVHKSNIIDFMPISEELDGELRNWLRYYQDKQGPLNSEWHLCPAKRIHQPVRGEAGRFVRMEGTDVLRPVQQMVRVAEIVQRTLAGIGFDTRTADGGATWEGVHTLRRSGARALFDEMSSAGYDGALRRVQAMLHHRSSQTTEHYLGLDLDRKQRDDAIKGKPLFPSLADPGVTTLRTHGERDEGGLRRVST